MAANDAKRTAHDGAQVREDGGREDHGTQGQEYDEKLERFPPEEEAAMADWSLQSMVNTSNERKTEANSLFTSAKYDAAIDKYDEAVAVCPSYLGYELAVLRSNVAACHLQLGEWKEAMSNATKALDDLDRVEKELEQEQESKQADKTEAGDDAVELEIVSPGAAKAGPALPTESKVDDGAAARSQRKKDISRIRAKALMRRARARGELGGWSNLDGALEDYKRLSAMEGVLSAVDKTTVRKQIITLTPRAKVAQEKETAEMWSKLKDLGNGLLKPFGLSTDNFKMVKDEKTGGYSMNFEGGGQSSRG
ncbi:hypothetical protein OQA88_2235 [Cercophora sp. LCS_1]